MNKIQLKLITVALALVLSVSVVAASSYAWMVLSANPVATGIQVAIGGGNTILVAPDVTVEGQDGHIYHYPGDFSDKMNFGQQEAYAYLKEIGNLNPVSTINGIDWILPVYYSGNDPQVQQGMVASGTLKDISEFKVDSELSYANIPAEETEKVHEGHYVYLDFWVVSPGGDYKLRVSTGVQEPDGGSFAIDVPEVKKTDTGYTLVQPEGSAASTVRIGFLANDLMLTDDTMLLYKDSRQYDERFLRLKGIYQEPETGTVYLDQNRFTIYEPNGDYHPSGVAEDGTYVETRPLGLIQGRIMDLGSRANLTVQKKSTWKYATPESQSTALEQRFQTALYAGTWKNLSADEIRDAFFNSYLQGQVSPYVQTGAFLRHTGNLYTSLSTGNGTVSAETLEADNVGATDDIYIIELERNVPQRLRMFVWLEGQDVDCVDSVGSSRFAISIELASGDN